MLSLILSTSNLSLQIIFVITLTLLFSFIRIPSLFLTGLHTYIHPDDANAGGGSGGIRAAIRSPSAMPKLRKKSKEKFEFDESKAQILRLKLNEDHLKSRIYFKQYYEAFNFTLVSSFSLLLHKFFKVDKNSGIVKNGTLIPIVLGLVSVCRLVFLIVKVGYEGLGSKKIEKQLSFVCGILGFFIGILVVYGIIPKWVIDFELEESLDGLGKLILSTLMGLIVGYLYIPTLRSCMCFWLGTDQLRCNLSIISCGYLSRMLLYTCYVMPIFTSFLWISPFTETFTKEKNRSSFRKLRMLCMVITGTSQLLAVRSNVQTFLNEAVLCWYQRLHESRVPDLECSRAKVFLHNHYLCLVSVKLFVPPSLVLVLVGLSGVGSSLGYSDRVKEAVLFAAWWIVFVWAVISSAILVLFRRGVLYIS